MNLFWIWYKTGDKGHVDEDGFLTIVDRYSRFAKLGGEMISLGSIEFKISESMALDGIDFCTVAVPDEIKGERIVLLFAGEEATEIHEHSHQPGALDERDHG